VIAQADQIVVAPTSLPLSLNGNTGNLSKSILITAKSVSGSVPTIVASARKIA
jgi:hypothetical protein